MTHFSRYVAIGDSTSEGLDDPDGLGGYRGWADRLAARIAAAQGSLLYANLAVRGLTTAQIRRGQLDRALAMSPDLATVVCGTNDILRPRFDAAAFAADVHAMQEALIGQGATVLTFTLPDLSPVLPLARAVRTRIMTMNDAIRASCHDTGAILCDFAALPVSSDPRLWSGDRLHANSLGHARMAEALAWHLGVPGVDRSWSEPLPDRPPPRWWHLARAEAAWMQLHFLPWVWRHLRGRSSADGRSCKRPELLPVEL